MGDGLRDDVTTGSFPTPGKDRRRFVDRGVVPRWRIDAPGRNAVVERDRWDGGHYWVRLARADGEAGKVSTDSDDLVMCLHEDVAALEAENERLRVDNQMLRITVEKLTPDPYIYTVAGE